MKILVCGGREFGALPFKTDPLWEERLKQYNFIMKRLNQLSVKYSEFFDPNDNWLPSDIIIINGAADGADSVSSDWAIMRRAQLIEYPADWKKHKKAAGPIRNQEMLDKEQPDLVVAFPGGKGTADMVARARKAGVEVLELKYE